MKKIAGSLFRVFVRTVLVTIFLPLLYAVEPFFRVRFGTLHFQRIGHLATNTDIFLRKQHLKGAPPRTGYFLFGSGFCNRQLFEMFRRGAPGHVHLIDSPWGTRIVSACYLILVKTRFWEALETDYAEFRLHVETPCQIDFTEEEELKGRAGLAEMGIGGDDWFVCFHARDGAYLRDWRPELSEFWDKNDWRNNDVENYFDALDYITSLGGFALRMGAVVDNSLTPGGSPRIIDYATKHRGDFMDIYLISKCRFFIGTNSGLAWVPPVFATPVVMVDYTPYSHSRLYNDTVIPRPLVTHGDGRVVSFAEALSKEFFSRSVNTSKQANKNPHLFTYGQSDADDILGACKDMIDLLEGRPSSREGQELQELYAETYLNHLPDYDLAAKVSARWAVKHRNLIVPGGRDEETDPALNAAG